ncbi:murein biosynthesis integral membrane protein MurJ [Candidatus Falkowbacteria bacterium]|jgi:putative peptidoglycan lipid II flippase|nr:murein biosynthesis integral membrane protein MurJ [Candidatus Falkowbacteria bacterium]
MLKKFFNQQINSITVAAALVALSSLFSRLLGVIRDRILAGQFGAGTDLDIYYAAFRVPDLIYNLIVLGALSAGFVPIFTSLIKDFLHDKDKDSDPVEKNQEAWSLANNILNIIFIALVGLSVLGIIFAPALTRCLTPGFSAESQAMTTSLTRIMFLSPIFLGISGVLGGILQSFKRFLVYSIAPIFYNLGIIIGALYFAPRWGLVGLAWGVALGAFLHMAVQIPAVYNLGFRYKLKIAWSDFYTKKIFKMMVPRTMSLAISQINLIVITVIATGLSSGSLAVFNLANNLQSFPIGIFGISFAIAAFPSLAATAFDKEKLTANFSQTFRQILFFIVPATVLIIALRAQIIRVILGTGNFDWQDTIMTMNTLGFFALSLFAQATIPLLVRVFYARQNSATPFYLGLVTVLVNIGLSFLFSKTLGVAGLALAFSIANILNFVLLWIWLYFSVGTLDLGKIIISVLKFTVSAIGAGLVTQIMKVVIWPFIDMTTFVGVFTQLVVCGLSGTLVYLLLCLLLKSEELFRFIASLQNRWPLKKIKLGDQGEARGV